MTPPVNRQIVLAARRRGMVTAADFRLETPPVVEGIENAPAAFLGLFSGDNLGKMVVREGPDPQAVSSR